MPLIDADIAECIVTLYRLDSEHRPRPNEPSATHLQVGVAVALHAYLQQILQPKAFVNFLLPRSVGAVFNVYTVRELGGNIQFRLREMTEVKALISLIDILARLDDKASKAVKNALDLLCRFFVARVNYQETKPLRDSLIELFPGLETPFCSSTESHKMTFSASILQVISEACIAQINKVSTDPKRSQMQEANPKGVDEWVESCLRYVLKEDIIQNVRKKLRVMQNPVNKARFAEQVHEKTKHAVVWLFEDSGVSSLYDIPTLKTDAKEDGIKIATLCLLARFCDDNFELNAEHRIRHFSGFLKYYSQEAVKQILTRWQQKKQQLRAKNAFFAKVKSAAADTSKKVPGVIRNLADKTMRKTSQWAHRIAAAPAEFKKAAGRRVKYMADEVRKVQGRKLWDSARAMPGKIARYAVMYGA